MMKKEMNKHVLQPEEILLKSYKSEYVVIGSGAGGSVAAMELSEAGKEVTLIEEGLDYTTSDFNSKISEMTHLTWRNGGVTPFWGKPPIGFAEGRCVGGTTVINGGLLWRTPDRLLNLWEKDYGLIGYSKFDLDPYFKKIENILKVGFHKIDDQNKDSKTLINGCKNLGWKYVPVPRSGGAECINSNLCPTGCISGAKQSTALTYLPRAKKAGAKIFTGSKTIFIKQKNQNSIEIIIETTDPRKHVFRIKCKYLFIAAGAVQTPFLLRKSNLSKDAGKKLEFHFNLKFVAEFEEQLNAQNGTIFTMQVQEFMDDGLLIMPSNYKKNYLAMALSHFKNETINYILDKYEYCGLFVAQVQAKSKARVSSFLRTEPFVTYSFNKDDLPQIINAIKKTTKLLFKSGAKKVYLPIIGSTPITDYNKSLDKELKNLNPKNLEIVTVHAMASCPMGKKKNSVVDLSGELNNSKNIFITDASILPTNIGESPQGTIMGFSHKILDMHLNNSK
jgi:choline dehydrogenase-like flavoprotein